MNHRYMSYERLAQLIAESAFFHVCYFSSAIVFEFKHSKYLRRLSPHADRYHDLLLDTSIPQTISRDAIPWHILMLAELYFKASHRVSRPYTGYLDNLGIDYAEKHNLVKAERLYELLLQQYCQTNELRHFYRAFALKRLAEIYMRMYRLSKERGMPRLMFEIPGEGAEKFVRTQIISSYISQFSFKYLTPVILLLVVWPPRGATMWKYLLILFNRLAMIIISKASGGNWIQRWKILSILVLYMVCFYIDWGMIINVRYIKP